VAESFHPFLRALGKRIRKLRDEKGWWQLASTFAALGDAFPGPGSRR